MVYMCEFELWLQGIRIAWSPRKDELYLESRLLHTHWDEDGTVSLVLMQQLL
jgi:hypothetical protein